MSAAVGRAVASLGAAAVLAGLATRELRTRREGDVAAAAAAAVDAVRSGARDSAGGDAWRVRRRLVALDDTTVLPLVELEVPVGDLGRRVARRVADPTGLVRPGFTRWWWVERPTGRR